MLEFLSGLLVFIIGVSVGVVGDIIYKKNYKSVTETKAEYLTDDKNFYSTDRAISMMSVKDRE